jgi:hypothetical protein
MIAGAYLADIVKGNAVWFILAILTPKTAPSSPGVSSELKKPLMLLACDVGVQADGDRLAVHHGCSNSIPPCIGHHRVLPEDEGVGFSRSNSMQSLLPFIATFMAMDVLGCV